MRDDCCDTECEQMVEQMRALVRPTWHHFVPYTPGKSMASLAAESGIDLADICKLASNENAMPPSDVVKMAFVNSVSTLARYPDGDGAPLKQALADELGVSPDCVVLGTGSNGLLDGLARLFLYPGQSALYAEHAFLVYRLAVQAVGAEGIEIPARHWAHDLDAFATVYRERQQMGQTPRLIFLANPNNPTGTWFDQGALESLLAVVDPTKTVLVLDEAYAEYCCDLATYPQSLALLPQHPNLVITRTFSKAWGLANLRVGYAIAHRALARWLNTERAPFNVPGVGLTVAAAALTDKAYLRRVVDHNQNELAILQRWCDEHGIGYIPSVANFVTLETGARSGMDVYEDLLMRGVIVRPIANYGLPHHVRVSIGSTEENLRFRNAFLTVL
ncbi:MAG: histidinol-phosphate transaminase [Gammaproteobacteria bacterium]